MRIVSEWTHQEMRVTVLHMNGRYSIKLESGLVEQVYKFRDGQFESLDDLKTFTNDAFYKQCLEIFKAMEKNKFSSSEQNASDSEFDEII